MKQFEREYTKYLKEHIKNVHKGGEGFKNHIDFRIFGEDAKAIKAFTDFRVDRHDLSKWSEEEFEPYAKYFFVDKASNQKEFDRAGEHHQRENDHHGQWGVQDGTPINMCIPAMLEMICDGGTFSGKAGNLYEIFDWYEKEKPTQVMTEDTRTFVETILGLLKEALDEEAYDPNNSKFTGAPLQIKDGKVDTITVVDTNPLKVFISVPMKNRTEEDIKKSVDLMMSKVKETCPEAEMVDSGVTEKPNESCKNTGPWYLGKSLEFLSQADLFVGLDDNTGYAGCEIEKQTAIAYDMAILILSRKEICPDL